MFRCWKFGRPFGIGVYVHPTFLLVLAWVMYSSREGGWLAAATTAALVVAVFGCVLLHEFGHALAARAFGIRTRDITLYPIGGVARLEGVISRPGEEILIALAGPAVNVVIALVLTVALIGLGVGQIVFFGGATVMPPGTIFLLHLLVTNILLVVFNMIPAFPMDGGRVLRGLLALTLDRLRATEIAAALGMVIATVFVLSPVGLALLGAEANPFLVLIGLFVFVMGRLELWAVRRVEAARRVEEIPEVLVIESEPPGPPAVWGVADRPLAPRPDGTE